MSDPGSYEDGLIVAYHYHRPFDLSYNAGHKVIQCTQFWMGVFPHTCKADVGVEYVPTVPHIVFVRK